MTSALHETVTFDVNDFKVWPLVTDDPGDPGPTYGNVVDVPGIAQVQVDPQFITAQLLGDAKVLAQKGRTSSFQISATYGLMSLDVLSTLFAGNVTDTGSGSGQKSSWKLSGTNDLPYMKASFIIEDVSTGIGDVTVTLYKAQISGGQLFNQQTNQFGQRTLQIDGIPCISDDSMIDVTVHKTLTPLPDPS